MNTKGGRDGLLVVVSGPSGCGKSTICRRLVSRRSYTLSVSATTRERRPGEQDGREYFFLTREEFLARVKAGDFLEHSEHFGNLYGTPRKPVDDALARGEVVLLEIDVNGARQVKENVSEGVRPLLIFIRAPDVEELRRRLTRRDRHKGPEAVRERLDRLEWEMSMRPMYDREVVNDELERAVAEIERIIETEARKRDG